MATPPRLSVVMFTDGPARFVAASLARVRPVAHEIVVAVDARVPVAELGPLEAVADRVVRAEFIYPLEANLAWLHAQATGDWILRLDGDDLVSEALLHRLAEPDWDAGITHAYLQYRWLWGDGGVMLDQAPWWPDPALRLIRNVPGIAHFPQGAHEPPQVAGDARFWDVPLYHLDLLVRDPQRRAAKALAYEHETPGHRIDRGWSVSSTYYLPERFDPPPRVAPLPPVDAAVVARVLAEATSHAPPVPPKDEAALRHVVTAEDRRPPPPVDGDARIRIVAHDPLVVVEGRPAIATVGITNLSSHPWSPHDLHPDLVGGRFYDASGTQVGVEVRSPLPGLIAPGEEGLVRLSVPAGLPPEALRLEVGLVQDGLGWHDARASISLRRRSGRRVLLSTGVSPFPHLGDDLITSQVLAALSAHLPDVVPVLLAHPIDNLAERFGCDVVAGPASLPAGVARSADVGRRARDLVTQARLFAKGDEPADPLVREVLEPFRVASALVLAPGGGLASRYSAEALMVCAVQALIARAFGLPVFIEGASIGPIELRRDHAALAQLLNDCTRLTVRDAASADAARRIGRAVEPIVVADPASGAVLHRGQGDRVASAWLAAHNVPEGRAYAVVSLRPTDGDLANLETVRQALDELPEHTAWIFLPHCNGDEIHDDLEVLRRDAWAGEHLVAWDPSLGDHAAVSLVAGASATLGTRFHLSVLAAAAGVRAVGLVADEYDRVRIRGLKRDGYVRVADLADPAAARAAMAAAIAAPPPESQEPWDATAFAAALERHLPVAPTLT